MQKVKGYVLYKSSDSHEFRTLHRRSDQKIPVYASYELAESSAADVWFNEEVQVGIYFEELYKSDTLELMGYD